MPKEQKKKKNQDIDYNIQYDDEIDLVELFRKIWKWKWLTIALVLIICILTFFYVSTKPVTYTIESNVRIGKIANVLVEDLADIKAYLETEVNNKNDACLANSILKNDIRENSKTNIIKISCTAGSPDIAFTCSNKAIKNLLDRHNLIYNKAIKKLNENISSIKTKAVIEPEYLLDTYTFPSSLLSKPEIPKNPDDKKVFLKVAVAFFSSLFLGIFLSLFIDYILAHRSKD